MIPTGTLHDDGRTLVLSRTFTAAVEEVWASVTESERLGRWFGTWTGDPTSGSVMVTMNAEPESAPADAVRHPGLRAAPTAVGQREQRLRALAADRRAVDRRRDHHARLASG